MRHLSPKEGYDMKREERGRANRAVYLWTAVSTLELMADEGDEGARALHQALSEFVDSRFPGKQVTT